METIEHFAKISLVARLLGRENLLSREEVDAAAGAARHVRHRGAGADLRRSDGRRRRGDPADCQVVQAPPSAPASGWCRTSAAASGRCATSEIRLTYRELTALIEDAVETYADELS